MPEYPHPIVVISKCLGFAPCRYDGSIIESSIIESIKQFVDFIEVCPECGIGMGVPREPVIIIHTDKKKLYQPATGIDLTDRIEEFSKTYLSDLEDFDGSVLKSKSPSCGIGTTKLYSVNTKLQCLHRCENGFFADAFLRYYPGLPVIDEQQLSEPLLRDGFLTKIFALASFRQSANSGKMKTIDTLIEYHTRNKLLLLSLDKNIMNNMGNIVANRYGFTIDTAYEKYLSCLLKILGKPMSPGLAIDTMMHAFGYFSRNLSPSEKFAFMGQVQSFREDMSVIFELRKWFLYHAEKHNVEYILKQTFFCPYPQELADILQIK